MQLGRYHVSTLQPTTVHSITLSEDGRLLAIAYEGGYEVWRTFPLGLVRRRTLNGTLARAVLVPSSPLLVLQGGGTSPLYPPNKAVIYHDGLGRPVAELEFGERIRGIAVRQSTICIVLSRKTLGFEYGLASSSNPLNEKGKEKDEAKGFWVRKFGEWETAENEFGLIALSTTPGSSLLVLPGRQSGHVQLIHLPHASSSRTTPFRPIILAHDHPLSTLICTPDGSAIITTSERGTLVRVWDTRSGGKTRELRRGVDRAEMWGTAFEPHQPSYGDMGRVVGWSDKGTIHVWATAPPETKPTPSLTHLLSRNLPLPKYFSSLASIAQYHLPRKNPHAFSSFMGAAADAAGVPSAKLLQPNGDDELSERFIVGWIDVPVERPVETDVTAPRNKNSTVRGDGSGTPRVYMGNREERRSFGSDGTSRTATPTFSRRSSGGKQHRHPSFPDRQASPGDLPPRISRNYSGQKHDKSASSAVDPSAAGSEKQLVAITYSGDYYRLRIPRRDAEEGEEGGSKKKCELVEYRRLKVGGGGW